MDQSNQCIEAFKLGKKHKAKELLSHVRDPVAVNIEDVDFASGSKFNLLHCAAHHGWDDLAKMLIEVHSLNPRDRDSDGQDALHFACSGGNLGLVRYLVDGLHCDPSRTSKVGLTPIHYACTNGRLRVVQYLITDLSCDPSVRTSDRKDNTPLHIACEFGHADVAQFLLWTGLVDPEAKNKEGNTPLYYAQRGSNIFEVFKVFKQCGAAVRAFPVHSFTKVILTGNSAAGKSSLAEVIKRRANRTTLEAFQDHISNRQVEVKLLTAGVNSLEIESEVVGNMILYDLAGQPEFYSSHFAVMENTMRRSPVIFINMVDLSKDNDSIKRSVYYWMNFIENACARLEEKSHVLMVGSHPDQLKKGELEEKNGLLKRIANETVKTQLFIDYVHMDCRKVESTGAKLLVHLLFKSQQELTRHAPVLSFYCHFLYAFLRSSDKMKDRPTINLKDLAAALSMEDAGEGDLGRHLDVLTDCVVALSDRGLVMFLKNEEEPEKSWIIVDKDVLLKEVNGTLFAPCSFEEYRPNLASSTGIIPLSALKATFERHNIEMLVWFLTSLEFCIPVEIDDIITNLGLEDQATLPDAVRGEEQLLFFPSLVHVKQPENVTLFRFGEKLSFGWCLTCIEPHQFFTPRFLHVLLLSIAFALSVHKDEQDILQVPDPQCQNLRAIQPGCNVWENGISWSKDVMTVVELIRQNKTVVVAMSADDKVTSQAQVELRSKLIALIYRLQKIHCPTVTTREFLLHPSLLEKYPLCDFTDDDIFTVEAVAKATLKKDPYVMSLSQAKRIKTENALPHEPYALIHPFYVGQLLQTDKVKEDISADIVHAVYKLWQEKGFNIQLDVTNRGTMKGCLDRLSIFRARNILELAGLALKDLPPAPPPPDGHLDIRGIVSTSEFYEDVITHIPEKWRKFGIAVEIRISVLNVKDREYRGNSVDIFADVFEYWRENQADLKYSVTWENVVKVLRTRTVNENRLADEIEEKYCKKTNCGTMNGCLDRTITEFSHSDLPSPEPDSSTITPTTTPSLTSVDTTSHQPEVHNEVRFSTSQLSKEDEEVHNEVTFSTSQLSKEDEEVHNEVTSSTSQLCQDDDGKKIYEWKGEGLKLELPADSNATVKLKTISSVHFKLPKGSSQVSPVYLVECEGDWGDGSALLELQHCVEVVQEKNLADLKFAVSRVDVDQESSNCKFELREGSFVGSSGKLEVAPFSALRVVIVTVQSILGVPSVLQLGLYYQKVSSSVYMVNFLVVPKQEAWEKMLLKHFDSNSKYTGSMKTTAVIKGKAVSLQLHTDNGAQELTDDHVVNGWKLKPKEDLTVYREEIFMSSSSDKPHPRQLELRWIGQGTPTPLSRRMIICGTEGCKWLLLEPPSPESDNSTGDEGHKSVDVMVGMEKCDPAMIAFHLCYSSIKNALDSHINAVVSSSFAQQLIPSEVHMIIISTPCMPSGDKVNMLLEAVEKHISTDSNAVKMFAEVLKKQGSYLTTIGYDLENTYCCLLKGEEAEHTTPASVKIIGKVLRKHHEHVIAYIEGTGLLAVTNYLFSSEIITEHIYHKCVAQNPNTQNASIIALECQLYVTLDHNPESKLGTLLSVFDQVESSGPDVASIIRQELGLNKPAPPATVQDTKLDAELATDLDTQPDATEPDVELATDLDTQHDATEPDAELATDLDTRLDATEPDVELATDLDTQPDDTELDAELATDLDTRLDATEPDVELATDLDTQPESGTECTSTTPFSLTHTSHLRRNLVFTAIAVSVLSAFGLLFIIILRRKKH